MNEKIYIEGGIIHELGLKNLTLKAPLNGNHNLYYPNKYEFIPPIVQDNSHITRNNLYGDKVSKLHFERILKTHGQNLIQKINAIGIFGPNWKIKRISKLLDLESCSEVLWFSNFKVGKDDFIEKLPDLIFLNIEDAHQNKATDSVPINSSSEGFKFEEIPALLRIIKTQDFYEPIIIVLNSPSHSLALQQVFQYEKIRAFQQRMTREVLLGIIEKYNNSYTEPMTVSSPHFIKVESQQRIFWLEQKMILHTLNEDYIEFFFSGDIPPYTWIHVDCPESLSVVVLPDILNISGPNKEKAYRARIMGLQGRLESYLRVFINFCFDNPQESFQNFNQIKNRVYDYLEEVEGNLDSNYNKDKAS